jgi:hypothetical protein
VQFGEIVDLGKYYVAKTVSFDPYSSYTVEYTSDFGQTWDSVFNNGGYAVWDTIQAYGFQVKGTELGIINTNAPKIIATKNHFQTLDTISTEVTVTDYKYTDLLVGVFDTNLALSTDSGYNWTFRPIPNAISLANATLINNSTVIVLDHDYTTAKERFVHVSNDMGLTWNRYYLGSKELEVYGSFHFINDSFGIVSATYKFGGVVLWTENQGTTWDTIRIPNNKIAYDLAVANDSTVLIAVLGEPLMRLNLNDLPEPSFLSTSRHIQPSFRAYPNPVENEFTLEFNSAHPIHLECYSIEGRLIFTRHYLPTTKVKLDIPELESGLYILSIEHNSSKETVRFIKE